MSENEENIISAFVSNPDQAILNVPVKALFEYQTILENLGYEAYQDGTDGWETTFWIHFSRGSEMITLSGSLFYGKYQLFKSELDDNI